MVCGKNCWSSGRTFLGRPRFFFGGCSPLSSCTCAGRGARGARGVGGATSPFSSLTFFGRPRFFLTGTSVPSSRTIISHGVSGPSSLQLFLQCVSISQRGTTSQREINYIQQLHCYAIMCLYVIYSILLYVLYCYSILYSILLYMYYSAFSHVLPIIQEYWILHHLHP